MKPMKAVLTDERFSDPDWIFERKLDGIRCLAFKGEDGVRLRSRNDLSLNGRFPEIVAALEDDPVRDVVLDGEVVAFDGAQTSFARLQQRGEHPVPVYFYVFDILRLAGEDVVLGYYEDGALRYAGKVGTGFTQATLRELAGKLAPLRQTASPFAGEVRERDVTWVRPELVAQVGFSEWTRDGRLRHPRFLGLRDDKPAADVVRERPR
jgi:ATP-dependent DNA ligase